MGSVSLVAVGRRHSASALELPVIVDGAYMAAPVVVVQLVLQRVDPKFSC